jgi:hypothetical protein
LFDIPILRFQSPISIIHDESVHQNNNTSVSPQSTASTITIVPKTTKNISVESHRSSAPSILHLTTVIDDDDDELFSTSRRKLPLAQVRISK